MLDNHVGVPVFDDGGNYNINIIDTCQSTVSEIRVHSKNDIPQDPNAFTGKIADLIDHKTDQRLSQKFVVSLYVSIILCAR